MKTRYSFLVVKAILLFLGTYGTKTFAFETLDFAKEGVLVRIAELEIDPKQLEAYKAAVQVEMADSVRLEPGVVSIYAVAIKDKPHHIRFFEIYANEKAYNSHIASPHFKKYVETTKNMITSRKLIETIPIQLSLKKK